MTRHGYYLESFPTPERRAEVRAACDAEARRVARIVGMAAWYEQFPAALTADEYQSLRRSFADDRNPGSVTMTGLFLEWMRDER
jgi:hypothetical protein